ncbi:hypothetical protein [Mesorhizobium sp. WSM2239]|uniref:Uncharacterized protein n=2 Tax=unclassified Mesorhizobium TaxID=325217 RepID=A0AAU8D5F9_9HYPH
MDGTAAININLEALKRILACLVAMAGLGPHPEVPADPELVEGEPRRTLPRHLRLAILRLLRPAEAAARRLIIAAARGLVAPLPPRRKPRPNPIAVEPLLRRFGIAVVMSPADLARDAAARRTAVARAARPRTLCLPLFDPPRRVMSPELVEGSNGSKGRRTVPAHAAPRILFPGVVEPFPLPPPPSPDDPVDATRLGLRLAALAAALDDLPGQAKRFARWQARNTRGNTPGRIRRISPLRRGRPPGGRLTRFDPSAYRDAARAQGRNAPRNVREVDEILAHAHALALYALQYPDTS